MPLFGKNIQEIVTQSLEDLSQLTNVTRLGAGGKARALLDTVGKRLEEGYDTFDLNLARAFLSSAPGQYLDLIGELLGEPRLPSIAASVTEDTQSFKWYVATGTFGTINGGSDIIITRGELVSTEPNLGGAIFRTTADITCAASANSAWGAIESTTPGESANVGSNSIKHHTFTGYTDSANNTLLATNVHPVGNGRGFESDANYRYRLSKKVLAAEAANETAVRLAALSVSGVADVVIVKYYRGIGSFAVIIKSVLPTVSQGLIDDVTVRVEKVAALGSLPYIKGPRELGVTMKLNVYYDKQLTDDEYATTESSMEEILTSGINGLDIGETLFLNRLISSLFTANTHIVAIGETNKLLEESYIYKPTRLEDNKIRQKLLGDYVPESDERIIIEQSVAVPITFTRNVKKAS